MTARGKSPPRARLRRAGAALLVASLAAQLARSDGGPESRPTAVAPEWSVTASHAIEWVRVVPEGAPTTVCYATVEGVFAVDFASGEPARPGPLVRARDIRPAQCESEGAHARALVVFDREGIHGLRPDRRDRLAWSFSETTDSAAAREGDPELLARWVDVAASEDRVIALNVDGRIVILDRASGAVRWRDDLRPLPVARLHVSAGRAAVLARQQGRVWAAILDLRDDRAPIDRIELETEWPIWSSFADDTLVVVSASTMRSLRASGPIATIALGWPQPPAMSICRISPRGVAMVRQSTLVALDVITGEALWRVPNDELCLGEGVQLGRAGDALLARSGDAAWLLECETGRLRARMSSQSGTVTVADGGLVAICPQADSRAWLVERQLPDGGQETLHLQWPGDRAPGAADGVGQVVWLPGRVVVSSGRSVACYDPRRATSRP